MLFLASCDDYHEFDDIVRHFAFANIKLNYQGVGFNGNYHAVFFTMKTTDVETFIALQKEKFSEQQSAAEF